MSTFVKYIVGKTYRPWLVRHLSRTRTYRFQDIRLEVPAEVFHPGFFFSTRFLLRHLSMLELKNRSFLELGAGSGLLGIYAAKRGSRVMASDINPHALDCLQKNAHRNGVTMDILDSDLFDAIPPQRFDLIAINPPYYKKSPLSNADHAWYCGENGEYFSKLFSGLGAYVHPSSVVLMVLCDGCDLAMIKTAACSHQFELKCVQRKKNLLEENFIYQIHKPHDNC